MGYSFSQLIFVILGVIYGIITLYSLMRLIHIRKFASDSTLAKYFYILLTFQNILSGASFFLLGLLNFNFENISQGDTKQENRLFWTLILVPDALFVITYIILFWQLVKLFYEGHSNTAEEIYLPDIKAKGIKYTMMYYALCIYIIVESVQMVLYIFDKLDFYEISIQLSIIIIIFSS